MQRERWVCVAAAVAGLALVTQSAVVGQTVSAKRRGVVSMHDVCDPLCEDGTGCGKAAMLKRRYAAGLGPVDDRPAGGAGLREAMGATDVLHNKIDIEIFPATETITGSNTFTAQSQVNGLTEFTFRLRNNYTVTSAVVNGSTPVTVTELGTTTKKATLDRAYNAGETFTLKIDYTGVAVSRGFGSIDFTTQNGQPLVETLSEAYFAYTWWPCKDGDAFVAGDNSDKATFEIFVTAPDTMVSVANGLLQGVDVLAGSRKRYRWATNYPMATYLACFASTNYNTWTQTYTYPLAGGGTGTMPVEFAIYPTDDTPGNRAAWEKCLTMMATYRPIYGEYPFINEKYGIYEFNFGGGMEHQTYTGQGTFSESVTAHELGHQWWGDNVTCETWGDIWLNEGFATYTEALWEERKPGSSGLPALFAAMAARRPTAVNDSVYCFNTADMNRIFSTNFTYRKGAWVLHMLRHVVGDAMFFDILAAHRAAHDGSAATTAEFAAVASSVAGRDLSGFFDQWVMQIGAPAYAFSWQDSTIGGANYLRLRIRQTQNAAWPTFAMPVDVRVDTAAGSQTAVVQNTARSQYFLVPISGNAVSAALDPNAWILATANASEAYVAGPPKIVSTTPSPGALLSAGSAVTQVRVVFSDPVTATGAAFAVTGPSGAVPFTYSYSAGTQTATLAFASALSAGAYTVTVADSITGNAQALDGEIASPLPPQALPSGNGVAGGAAVFGFTIGAPACPADYDHNGAVEPADIAVFVNTWLASLQNSTLAGDFDSNGAVEPADIAVFVNGWLSALSGGC